MAQGDDRSCGDGPDPAVVAAEPRWEVIGGVARIVADPPDDLTYSLHAEVRLGSLGFTWSEGPFEVGNDGVLRLLLTPPPDAFLHDLATDYVTDLAVRVDGTDEGGQVRIRLPLPRAYLAWPAGQGGGVGVWDEATMQTEAPLGVIDDALRADLDVDLDPHMRVLVPLGYAHAPIDDDS